MEIIGREQNGIRYWVVPTWEQVGFSHGFCGRDIDVRSTFDSWAQTFGAMAEREFKVLALKQIHSNSVISISSRKGAEMLLQRPATGDALVMAGNSEVGNEYLLTVKTADCFPLLLVDAEKKIMAAIHSGWRGAATRILTETIERMKDFGARTECLELAIGPGAQACCYEVGIEVIKTFKRGQVKQEGDEQRAAVIQLRGNRPFLSISQVLSNEAEQCGIAKQRIALVEKCTICSHEFFSYRREKEKAGRQMSFIGLGKRF